ncbi:AAA family ATPase [Listeria monocytogenes]|uniref:AAA family ATPase n=1 Tax=Listeria monocytogenes TaxID=1639 RepID=UPI0008547476|nr:AAA family ATPase [Listeria monocytogenes]EAD7601820.1 ATP-dependent Clp protease ATP-binding subunit [Listeria monocytogenes]OEP29331.1 ATP-binding protein [Listeria monocytogenes]OEP51864.1 ATP-binding protein [Listeria monocytogenes]HAA0614619.1 AAA domain-containing protein [Listeria monocytogenes]
MAKLIIFNRIYYKALKKEFEDKGMELIDISTVYSFTQGKATIDYFDSSIHVIDMSVLGSLNFKENIIKFIFPEIVRNFFDNATFITDCDEEDFKDNMSYIFTIEKYLPKKGNAIVEKTVKRKRLITDLSNEEIKKLTTKISESLIGHDRFKEDLLELFLEFKMFNAIKENKVFSIFIMGDSGVGKTEVAKLLHKYLMGNKQVAKINFGNYSSQGALNSLIGSPRGYIGSENGELFDKIENSNVGVILIDEFEKATPEVFNYFLEILESGVATSMLGEEIELSGYIFIFTSNVSVSDYEKVFSPELRSRFNYVSSFNPLTRVDKNNYLYTRFSKYVSEFNEVFDKRLGKLDKESLESKIDVDNYQNMRILNTVIRQLFMSYVKEKYPNKKDKIWQ